MRNVYVDDLLIDKDMTNFVTNFNIEVGQK